MSNNMTGPAAAYGKPNPAAAPNLHAAETEQHTVLKSVIMHLFPGVLITIFYVIAAPFFVAQGFPPVFALCLAMPVVLAPVELGYLLYKGKKANGRLSLKGIVLYRERARVWEYIVFGLLIIVCAALSVVLTKGSVGGFIAEKFFSWAPDWYVNGNSFEGSKPVLLATWIMIMVFANILGPAVEELYFRGYLLPRISRFKGWAPVINTVLFSAYHFWSPWEVVTRIIGVLPVSFVAYGKKNIYIGMIAHITLNTLGTLSLLALIFK